MKWILTETVENLEVFRFHYCFGYDLEGSTTWELFSQDSYCGLQTDESITCMLSVAVLDWIAADRLSKEKGWARATQLVASRQPWIVSSEMLTRPWVLTHPHSRWRFCFRLKSRERSIPPWIWLKSYLLATTGGKKIPLNSFVRISRRTPCHCFFFSFTLHRLLWVYRYRRVSLQGTIN